MHLIADTLEHGVSRTSDTSEHAQVGYKSTHRNARGITAQSAWFVCFLLSIWGFLEEGEKTLYNQVNYVIQSSRKIISSPCSDPVIAKSLGIFVLRSIVQISHLSQKWGTADRADGGVLSATCAGEKIASKAPFTLQGFQWTKWHRGLKSWLHIVSASKKTLSINL